MVSYRYARDCYFQIQSDLSSRAGTGAQDGETGPCDSLRRTRGRSHSTASVETEELGGFFCGYWKDHRRYRFSRQRRRRLGRFALMKLLLDTHVWLWSALDRARLSRRVVAELQNPA